MGRWLRDGWWPRCGWARRGAGLALVAHVACSRHRVLDDAELLRLALIRADQIWEARDTEGLDAAERALGAAPASMQRDPEVLWRLARIEVARGVVAGTGVDARRAWTRARDLGSACLLSDSGLRAELTNAGWPAAVKRVGIARVPCLAYAAEGWVRWMVDFGGEPATIDESTLRWWIDAVGWQPIEGGEQRAAALRALLATAQEAQAASAMLAEVHLAGRAAGDGAAWVRWEDLLRVTGGPPPGVAGPAGAPRTPEDKAAFSRIGRGAAR